VASDRDDLLALYRARVADYDEKSQDDWRRWCRTVLGHGGDLVVPPTKLDPDLDFLLEAAVPQSRPVKSLELEGSCHSHVTGLWLDRDIDAVGTGYALSGGLWRQHSWGIGRDGVLWETKWTCEHYIGVTLPSGEPTVRFVLNNYAGDIKEVLRQGSVRAREIIAVLRASRER
jgi:hypothetical protein